MSRDWATDFDHMDPEYARRTHEIWDDVRERCPVAHGERYGGVWVPLTYELIREIAYDTDRFSSWGAVIGTVPSQTPPPVGPAPPITSDPPFHRPARKLLLPSFAPKRIAELEDDVRSLCRERLDAIGELEPGAVFDAALEYTQHVPVGVICRLLGIPPSDDELLRGFVHDLLEGIHLPPEEQKESRRRVDAYIDDLIESHRREPRDTLVDHLLQAEIFGEPLTHEHVRGTVLVIMLAGVDTTWSAIGSVLWHLARHPEDRVRLRTDPEIWTTALEELLRAFAPATMGRIVKEDTDFHGCPMKEGDWILLPFPAANRDPEVFDRADEVVLDREQNRHAAFGLGMHRCIGSNLARLELRVAVQELLERFPHFELADPDAVRWSTGQIRGPRRLPLRVVEGP